MILSPLETVSQTFALDAGFELAAVEVLRRGKNGTSWGRAQKYSA